MQHSSVNRVGFVASSSKLSSDAAVFSPPTVSFAQSDSTFVQQVSGVLQHGILRITDLPADAAPSLKAVRELLSTLARAPCLTRAANAAAAPEHLVWKDAYGEGRGDGVQVDEKRVLDLSAARLEAMNAQAPQVAAELGASWQGPLQALQTCERTLVPLLLSALVAAGAAPPTLQTEERTSAYRLVDYFSRSAASAAPRCGQHQDFGTLSVIFADAPGLEIQQRGSDSWQAVSMGSPDSALVVFGKCTQVRSQGRVPALVHRVTNPSTPASDVIPRRTSAVLFVAPASHCIVAPFGVGAEDTSLSFSGTAQELKALEALRWRKREGTEPQGAAETEVPRS